MRHWLLPTALCVAVLADAHALQVQLTRAELFELSTLVVAAEVTGTEVQWGEGPDGLVETRVWLATDQVLEGDAPDTLEIVLEGGRLDGFTTWVEDVPILVEDHRYLLFLTADASGALIVLGGEAGAIELRSDLATWAPTLDETAPTIEVPDAQ